jgi:hypothetical protein
MLPFDLEGSMSETGETNGIATIDVDAIDHVTVTQRVHSTGGGVLWIVTNKTAQEVTVCVTNFRPHSDADRISGEDIAWLIGSGGCTRRLKAKQQGQILAFFIGVPGAVYDYDVTVNGNVAADPQLVI